ncbi:hypothetical protein C4N9_21180 [Pararhodobacter marinus]|uniref:Uncharacterized protein n=1 Tax=Pararhodobacter marinus TaxID=2184063 RepID=A0A2U2C3Z9_9RHOB|nr:hypothetical protein [Pararhodobacter marinus]PWE26615.1 hypothetical protein C4N9_21180 [Pararhodobacter marinus]
MFKIALIATALSVTALGANAAPTSLDTLAPASPQASLLDFAGPAAEAAADYEQTAYYCGWVTVYDAWGNWVTVWQCY